MNSRTSTDADYQKEAGVLFAELAFKQMRRDLADDSHEQAMSVIPDGLRITRDQLQILKSYAADMLCFEEKEWSEVVPEKDPFPELRWPGKEKVVRRGIRQHQRKMITTINRDSPVFRSFDQTLRQLAEENVFSFSYCLFHKGIIESMSKAVDFPYTTDGAEPAIRLNLILAVPSRRT